jgi:glyoxylase-like metal-dependent hydrolase (beta-lactamase superfamily II)
MLAHPASADEGLYHVYALRYARQTGRLAKDNFMLSPMAGADAHDGPMPVSYYIWIIRNRFRTVVVDSGISPRASVERGRTLDLDPIDTLSRLGVDPEEVADVVITHLHYDHASNIHRFGKARLHIQEAEVAYVTGSCMCEPFLRAPFDVEDVLTLMRRLYADRVVFHNGDASPFPGISVHVLPGHSPGIQAVRVETPRGPVLLASDVSHFFTNFLQRRPFRVTVDVVATHRSYRELMKIAGSVDRIIPGHDPKVRALYPKYNVNGVEVIALHERPQEHTLEDLVRVDPE